MVSGIIKIRIYINPICLYSNTVYYTSDSPLVTQHSLLCGKVTDGYKAIK